jgi:hypothetical protein
LDKAGLGYTEFSLTGVLVYAFRAYVFSFALRS